MFLAQKQIMKCFIVTFLQVLQICCSFEMNVKKPYPLVNNFIKTTIIYEIYKKIDTEMESQFNENILSYKKLEIGRKLLDKLFVPFHEEASFYFHLRSIFSNEELISLFSNRHAYYKLLKLQEVCLLKEGLFIVNNESLINHELVHIQYLKTNFCKCNGCIHSKKCLIRILDDLKTSKQRDFRSFYNEISYLFSKEKKDILLYQLNNLLFALNSLLVEYLFNLKETILREQNIPRCCIS